MRRKGYTKDEIRQMRAERKTLKPKVDGVPQIAYQKVLGDLIAAGHMNFSGIGLPENNNEIVKVEPSTMQLSDEFVAETTTIQFTAIQRKGLETRPHMTGYITSGHENDPKIRVKAWFNKKGNIRIELVI
jgi:hypothetical protein